MAVCLLWRKIGLPVRCTTDFAAVQLRARRMSHFVIRATLRVEKCCDQSANRRRPRPHRRHRLARREFRKLRPSRMVAQEAEAVTIAV
jgi:hypothetical protein